MNVFFLGTSGSIPTNERNLISIAIKREGKIYLFDPGENTQQKMIQMKLSVLKVNSIFITHLHGDHIMGIPGLIMTSNLLNRNTDLTIFGPPGTKNFIDCFITSVIINPNFNIIVNEITSDGLVYEDEEFQIFSGFGEHGCFSLFYSFNEKPRKGKFNREKAIELNIPMGPTWKALHEGKDIILPDGRKIYSGQVVGSPRPGHKIVIALDTRPNEAILAASRNADLLIFDGTFDDSLKEKAIETGHSTAKEGALLAKEASVKQLVLIHFSSRYSDLTALKDDVKDIFPDTMFPDDLTKIELVYNKNERE